LYKKETQRLCPNEGETGKNKSVFFKKKSKRHNDTGIRETGKINQSIIEKQNG
jgi:hypothetical protein